MNELTKTVIVATPAALLLLSALLIGGCASLSNADANNVDPVRDVHDAPRAQRVFLYQSRVANALMDRYPLMEILENADPAVVDAEAQMTAYCGPLTQTVLAELQGEKPSFALRWRVMSTIGKCERAARKIEDLLNRVEFAGAI
ncbi:MAG: hypothetical protein O3C28_03405 [Proteobacteria bacterium]|nr:hypothetical protein [Pseudomonadota bacterium]